MNNKWLFIVLAVILVGMVLLGIAAFIHLFSQPKDTPFQPDSGAKSSGRQELAPFHQLDVSVISGDILIKTGKNFAVDYNLHDRETVTRLEVRDDTLYFDTGIDFKWNLDHDDWKVIITVPADTKLGTVRLSTTAGSIRMEGYTLASGEMTSTAGTIALSGLTADSLNLSGTAQPVQIKDSTVGVLTAANTAASVEASGTFKTVALSSISGSCTLDGTVSDSASMETVTGDLIAKTPGASIDAHSIGKITVDGKEQGRSFSVENGKPSLTLKSTSGSIAVTTK